MNIWTRRLVHGDGGSAAVRGAGGVAVVRGAWCAVVVALTLVGALAVAPTAARAASLTTSGGNVFSSDATIATETDIEHDLYWAGRSLTLKGTKLGGDVIAAGETLELDGVTTKGSVRIAGRDLTIANSSVTGNVTAAGATVTVGNTTTVNAAYLAGESVTFAGTADELGADGNTVTISGTINGDVNVIAESVRVTDDAVITGTLHVTSSTQPEISSDAQVGDVDVHIDETGSSTAATAAMGLLYAIVATCVISLLLALVFPAAVDGAAVLVRQRTAPVVVSGIVGTICWLPALIVLFVLIATIPVGVGLIGVTVAIACVALPFAGASLTRIVRPGWNRFGAAAAGGAVLGLASWVPIVGTIVGVVSFVYLLGYVIQVIWAGIRHGGTPAQADNDVPQLPDGTSA